jgi:type I restriction enzyme S subunit
VTATPSGWTEATLGEIARWGSGGTPRVGERSFYGGDISWAVIGDLNDGVVHTTAQSITTLGLARSSAKLVPGGAVLIAMYGSIGKLGIAGRDMATNQAIAAAVVNEAVIDRRFLFYYLLSQREQLSRAGKGATQQNIGQGVLKAWPIARPTLDEQRRIVDVLEDHLSRLDAGRDQLRAAQRRNRSLRDAALRVELLGHRWPGDRLPCDLPTADVDDGVLSDLPAGWEWRRLQDVADVVGGVTKDASKQGDPSFVEVPYLRVANVQRGRLDLRTIARIRVPPAKLEQLRLEPGDVLLNEGGDRDKLGRGWVWAGEIEDCITQNHVFRARPRPGTLHPKLLSWAANSLGGPWCERNGKQSVNLASISLKRIRLMPVPVPPLDAQAPLVLRLEDLHERSARLDAVIDGQLARGAALRRSLLASAFSGKL